MGAGHSHSHDVPDVPISGVARKALVGFLIAVAVATIAGLVWLWPTGERPKLSHSFMAPGVLAVPGNVTKVVPCPDDERGQGINHDCQWATVDLKSGPEAGTSVDVELLGVGAWSGIQPGDAVTLMRLPAGEGQPMSYAFMDVDRMPTIIVLGVLFLVAVIAVAGRKGFFGLVGLVIAGAVFFLFIIPGLVMGKPPVAVAIVGSTAIMFVVLYVAHGVSMRTSSAFAGTLLGLLLTTGLGAVSVWTARLSGLADEESLALTTVLGQLNYADIFTCSIVIAGLGVLNDVTITQSSSVWELRAAAPGLSRRELFASGMRIGRDHIASTIYTIVFAYAGASMSVLLMLSLYHQPLHLLLSAEMFASEIIRTLGSSIGLVLSVPLTTGVAALTVGGAPVSTAPRRALVEPTG